ncbi:MAG: hypothetical protein A2W91_03025 [Bacteroidetes bacterium GWF2_38_335]|nr:MAG: hypothetical protein A2W91_03025 [Bacteroidetes bacterium GWF2_38_335]OFY77537.1 MAG: hypothetical protein A2281_01735 [Bacteroidetes bacterium RIFOXYA12_FULL_38_20]HBS87166.1 hypothetical protein [Bacteroidales bacterium]
MKKADIFVFMLVCLLVLCFMPIDFMKGFQKDFLFNKDYWYITSFLKFGILATLGEAIGLRITKGIYNYNGFGLIPRAIVWGFLGICIQIAFVVFGAGSPVVLEKLFNVKGAIQSMWYAGYFDAADNGFGTERILSAVTISILLNMIFAPVFMTYHKITDTHILNNKGTLGGFLRWIDIKGIFPVLNWKVQWNFIFKKTIPFFWIPAHTVTFLLVEEYRIIFAALLGIVLGIILAIANQKKN